MGPAARTRRGWRQIKGVVTVAAGITTLSFGAGIAAAGGGGVGSPGGPELTDVLCLEECAGQRTAAVGSRVQLSGRNLDGVTSVAFAADSSGRVSVRPTAVAAGAVEARVPDGAATGTVKVDAYGESATTPRKLTIVSADQVAVAGEFALRSAEASPRKAYYDAKRSPKVKYLFVGGSATDVRIAVVNRETSETVATFLDRGAEPNAQNSARWDGRTDAGALAPNGEYKFEIASAAGGAAKTTVQAQFGYHKFRFPVVGRHSYGDGFGAGRNHQGQDVFASCGKRIVAARGGRVQWNKVHRAAGNYVVVDAKGTKSDFMYAHLQERSPLAKGSRVRTGQVIGRVGDSGNASGCHLHFEAWSAPGWYEGGDALASVTRMLKAWDRWS